mmetsp:Transcript_39461/g.78893  ORF Transcript_39461/g.78893 Transcript_39461/m.78893 type:complete len:328 (+) Transcript_39461:349-1332(+)
MANGACNSAHERRLCARYACSACVTKKDASFGSAGSAPSDLLRGSPSITRRVLEGSSLRGCGGIGWKGAALLILANSRRNTRSRSSQVRSRMSMCSSGEVGRLDGFDEPSAGRRPRERGMARSSSALLRPTSALTCSIESSRKVSTSLRFCKMTDASLFMCESSLVFSRTSWRSPCESSSASAIFRWSCCSNVSFSFSKACTECESVRSRLFTFEVSSLFSLLCRKPCLAYSLTACSLSATSRRSFLLSSSSDFFDFCSSSVSATCSLSSSAIRRFSKRIFLVDESSRSTASSCEDFFISASICLYSFCSRFFSSRNFRSSVSIAYL